VIVLDTTVLVYAVGGDHPLAGPCRRLVEAAGEGRLTATTTAEAIQEFVHVRARRRTRRDAAELGRSYAELLSPLLAVSADALAHGLRLFERHPALGAFDAVLAAVALDAGAEALVSADRAFGSVRGLRWVDPAGPGFERLLAGAG
jgi:predicted nucleic acid-binding protein